MILNRNIIFCFSVMISQILFDILCYATNNESWLIYQMIFVIILMIYAVLRISLKPLYDWTNKKTSFSQKRDVIMEIQAWEKLYKNELKNKSNREKFEMFLDYEEMLDIDIHIVIKTARKYFNLK